jgi:hypothetical protein
MNMRLSHLLLLASATTAAPLFQAPAPLFHTQVEALRASGMSEVYLHSDLTHYFLK